MSTINFSKTSSRVQNHSDELEAYWPNLAKNDVGQWLDVSQFSDKTIQITGTLGTGGEITVEGSLDGGTTAFTLTQADTTAFVLNALGGAAVLEAVPLIRVNATNGDGTTYLSCYIFAKASGKR